MQELYRPGYNCWRLERADYLSIVVDYGNYYRDLHESIVKARRSIFLLGWDIDSRIELLRGEDARNARAPVTFYDLICWKAKQNPDIRIYLNRWDYLMFFARQREPFAVHHWASADLPNIHYCLDDCLPLAACHHQKLAVIDDETAYWGGMDIALARWDFREHHVRNKNRVDPAQLPHFNEKESFSPYHDVQAVLAGPAAGALAEWARTRWRAACREEPIPFQPPEPAGLPRTWPDSDPPDFENVTVAIARTLPKTRAWPQTEEIAALWPAEIARAENFIYIENQFLASQTIAKALNKRLRERPNLRILAVSCWNPQGAMERKAMWTGRVKFRDTLESGGVADRVALSYPLCREDGKQKVVRVHSKLMIIDDRFMHIGSANINDRSLGMDSELDVTILGEDEKSRAKIASVRNDLIREHTGYEIDEIARMVDQGGSVQDVIRECPGSRQHLCAIDDEQYRHERFAGLAKKLADPRRPIIPQMFTRLPRPGPSRFKARNLWIAAGIVLLLAALSLLWSHTPLREHVSAENLEALMIRAREAPLAGLWVVAIYVIGGLVFVPVTGLSAAVILVFGGTLGFIYSLAGSLASGLTGYAIGKWIGSERLARWLPGSRKIMRKLKDSGIVGVAVIRTLPIAPYSLMNLVFGVVNVSLFAFIGGTILGLFPGKMMMAIFGDSLAEAFKNPDPKNIVYAVIGLAAWIAVVMACNRMARRWEARHA